MRLAVICPSGASDVGFGVSTRLTDPVCVKGECVRMMTEGDSEGNSECEGDYEGNSECEGDSEGNSECESNEWE